MVASLVLFLFAGGAPGAAPQNPATIHFERGRALFEEHDDSGEAMREAETEFRTALALDPRHAASLAYLGLIAADRERWADAGALYRKALQFDPRCAESRVGLARICIRDRRHDEARALLRKAAADRPANRLALRELAGNLTGENFKPTDDIWHEAMKCWQALIRLDQDDRDAHHQLAQAHRRFGHWAAAESEYREVLRIGQTPEDSDVWVYSVHGDVAGMLEKQGKTEEAIREWRALAESEGAGEAEIEHARARIRKLAGRR